MREENRLEPVPERRAVSIQRRIYSVLWTITVVFLALHLCSLLQEEHMVRRISQLMDREMEYNSYLERLDGVQDLVMAYFNGSSSVSGEVLEQGVTDFTDYVDSLLSFFAHPQFVDNRVIVGRYVQSIREFIRLYPLSSAREQLEEYRNTARLCRLLKVSFHTTGEISKTMIREAISAQVKRFRFLEGGILLFSLLLLALTLRHAQEVIRSITRPIVRLTDRCRQILINELSDASVDRKKEEKEEECLETQILTEAYQEMIEQLRDQMAMKERMHTLEVEHMQTQMALRQAELRLMQSLISPHFLFNCMGTLSSLAFLENAERTQECAIALSRYLRSYLDRIGKKVTLEEEVSHTGQYIEIQKLRFGERLCFQLSLEEDLYGFEVPALILQPLLENSLGHGLSQRREDGLIDTVIRREEDAVLIQVTDNGEGMTPEEIRAVEEDLGKPFVSRQKGIGLRSVYYRLNDAFPGKVSLKLSSENGGTRVRIRIAEG